MAQNKFIIFAKIVFINSIAAIIPYNWFFRALLLEDVLIICQIMGLSIFLFAIIGKKITDKKNLPSLIGVIPGMSMGIFFGCVLSWRYLFVIYNTNLDYFLLVVPKIIIFGFIFGIPAIYLFFSRKKIVESEQIIQQEKIKRLSIEKEAAMTSLRLLQAQIEPHFLFNTLANIISLFDIDAETAKKMLIDFNEYLRICLQRTRQEMITLAQELDLVHRYLKIFKIRMDERLSYEINDHTNKSDLDFPPLIIQPLVENSIKYGIEPKIEGGHITISCRIQNDILKINISDTGQGLDSNANQAGIGINNVSQRLENIYGDDASLTIRQNHPTGVKIEIKVPL